jgi:hypothetical protein
MWKLFLMVEGTRNVRRSLVLQSLVKSQESHFEEWLQEDRKNLNQYEIIQVFREFHSALDLWQGKTFIEKGQYGGEYQMSGAWDRLTCKSSEFGLEIQQVMLKVPCLINLRSLAVEIKISTRISFHSSFYVFTRVVDKITERTPVLKICKDVNLRSLFFVCGYIEPKTRKFKFMKQKQVTEIVKFSEPHRELEISVLDNGNDKIYVNITNGVTRSIEGFHFCCCGFFPETRDSGIWVAATGDSVSLKNLSVQYKDRINVVRPEERSNACNCLIY